MANIKDARKNAIDQLEKLGDDDSFTLLTREEESGSYSLKTYTADRKQHIDHLNKAAAYMLFLHTHFDDYSLDEVARDCLKTARLQAQGGELGE